MSRLMRALGGSVLVGGYLAFFYRCLWTNKIVPSGDGNKLLPNLDWFARTDGAFSFWNPHLLGGFPRFADMEQFSWLLPFVDPLSPWANLNLNLVLLANTLVLAWISYRLARIGGIGREASLVAAILVGSTGIIWEWTTKGRPNVIVSYTAILGALFMQIRGFHRHPWSSFALAAVGVGVALAMLAHYAAMVSLPLVLLVAWAYQKWDWRRLPQVLAYGAGIHALTLAFSCLFILAPADAMSGDDLPVKYFLGRVAVDSWELMANVLGAMWPRTTNYFFPYLFPLAILLPLACLQKLPKGRPFEQAMVAAVVYASLLMLFAATVSDAIVKGVGEALPILKTIRHHNHNRFIVAIFGSLALGAAWGHLRHGRLRIPAAAVAFLALYTAAAGAFLWRGIDIMPWSGWGVVKFVAPALLLLALYWGRERWQQLGILATALAVHLASVSHDRIPHAWAGGNGLSWKTLSWIEEQNRAAESDRHRWLYWPGMNLLRYWTDSFTYTGYVLVVTAEHRAQLEYLYGHPARKARYLWMMKDIRRSPWQETLTPERAALLGVRYWITTKEPGPGWKLAEGSTRNDKVYENLAWKPGLSMRYETEAAEGWKATRRILERDDFAWDHVVVLPPDAERLGAGAPAAGCGTAQWTLQENDRLRADVRTCQAGYLYVPENYHAGWKATVNDQPVPVYRANYFARAIPLPPGEHVVEMTFEPAYKAWGLAGLLLILMAIAGGLILDHSGVRVRWPAPRSRRPPQEPLTASEERI